MRRTMKWLTGIVLASGLLFASGAGDASQPVGGYCADTPVMGSAFGSHPAGSYGAGAEHQAIADVLGMSSQELTEARAAGASVSELARDRNVELSTLAGAALGAHSAQLEAAVRVGRLSQVQADAMQVLMKARIEDQLEAPRCHTDGG
jgi:hypothetical protein